jgi:hypothetical protein
MPEGSVDVYSEYRAMTANTGEIVHAATSRTRRAASNTWRLVSSLQGNIDRAIAPAQRDIWLAPVASAAG